MGYMLFMFEDEQVVPAVFGGLAASRKRAYYILPLSNLTH